MKKSIQIIVTTFAILFGNFAFSQVDSVYIVRGDSVLSVYATTEVDSIKYYKWKTWLENEFGGKSRKNY